MIKLKEGGLYVSHCGCLLKGINGTKGLDGIRLVCVKPTGCVSCGSYPNDAGETWFYYWDGGLFGGDEGTKDSHLHIAREIEP